jgi:hypothetical protein
MAQQQYPLVFEPSDNKRSKAPTQEEGPVPWPWPWEVKQPAFSVELETLAGQECHEFVLARIRGWPETKTEFDMRCIRVFGHKICTKVPVIYHRSCTLEVVVVVCYPTGYLNDVTTCITGAGMAAAVAAVISGGSAAAGTFKAALEACLLAKGAKWANQISVNVPPPKTECGPWHPI